MISNSSDLTIRVLDRISAHIFEAQGANFIDAAVQSKISKIDKFAIVLDFTDIDAVSTSFAGRLKEHIVLWKMKPCVVSVRIVNAKLPVKNMFI